MILNITHNDLDGILSNHLIKKAYGECETIIASHNELEDICKNIKTNEWDKIIFTDICPKDKEFILNNKNIMVLDHHSFDLPNEDRFIFAKNGESACKLIFNYFQIKGSENLEKAVEIIDSLDTFKFFGSGDYTPYWVGLKYKNDLDGFIQDIETREFLNVKTYEEEFEQFKNELVREEFNFHNWKGLFLTHKDLDKVENFWALATADIVNATDGYDFVCIRRKGEISFSRNLKQTKLHIGDLVKAIGRDIYKTTNAGGRDVVGGITI